VLEPASSGRRTSTFSTSWFWTASISSILSWEASLYSRASSTHEPPTRPNLHVGACPNWQRDAPPSCAPASPAAGRHAQCANRPRIRQEHPLRQAAARQPGSPPQSQARSHLDGPRRPISPRPPTEGSGPVLGPCTQPNPEAEAKAEAESRRGPRLLRAKSSDPHHQASLDCQWHVLSLRREYSGQSNTPPRLRRSKSSSTVPRTRHTIRPAAPSLRLLESDAASGTAAQQRSAGCRMCRPQRDRSQVALGCNTVHVVATWRMWLQHSVLRCCVTLVCCAEADVPEGSSGDTDVGLGMDSVAVQMWAGLD
jgi:hypothetical protein